MPRGAGMMTANTHKFMCSPAGHCATVHACTIGDNSLIGMGATVLDGAKVESGAIVAAGSVVSPRTVVPSGQVWRMCGMFVCGDIQPYGLH